MSRVQRIVGFDCGEDTHIAVLWTPRGNFAGGPRSTNERGQIQELLAELMLIVGPEAAASSGGGVEAVAMGGSCRMLLSSWVVI